MSEPAHSRQADPPQRGRRLAGPSQQTSRKGRLAIHCTRCPREAEKLGNPLAICLTGGQVHAIAQAVALLAEVEPQALIADKGYDADGFIDALTVRRIEPISPVPSLGLNEDTP